MTLAFAVLLFVTLQRLGELLLARRNTKALLARGGFEVGAKHYPLIVALHTAWLAGLWLFAWNAPVNLPLLGIFVCLQLLRVWVLTTLKGRWTTRIIVLPDAPLVVVGPYRLIRHPNYAVVIGEIAVLPAAFGLWSFALIFSILNAVVLWHRISVENRSFALAKSQHPAVQSQIA